MLSLWRHCSMCVWKQPCKLHSTQKSLKRACERGRERESQSECWESELCLSLCLSCFLPSAHFVGQGFWPFSCYDVCSWFFLFFFFFFLCVFFSPSFCLLFKLIKSVWQNNKQRWPCFCAQTQCTHPLFVFPFVSFTFMACPYGSSSTTISAPPPPYCGFGSNEQRFALLQHVAPISRQQKMKMKMKQRQSSSRRVESRLCLCSNSLAERGKGREG